MSQDPSVLFRNIPAVDKVLMMEEVRDLLESNPRSVVKKGISGVLEDIRKEILSGAITDPQDMAADMISERVRERVRVISRPSLRPLVNATGVIVHTNLGRSLLAERVLQKIYPVAGGYSNLEYDLEEGQRGSRYSHVVDILKELTGAEGALVVNNNAAAVFVSLETLAKGKEVPVSRGQLVEIGGSFRIPDVMSRSGAKMVGVGTTNKTHLRDYEGAIGPDTALLLKVHTSNFQVVGFTKEVPLAELAELGNRHGIPVMEDLGSGCLVDLARFGMPKEPTVQEALSMGVDLVTFSGDKLLGGPQAGIILGKKEIVDAIRKNPINRAVRIDKMTLVALEETLRIYRDPEAAVKEIPTLKMISAPYEAMVEKAERILSITGTLEKTNFTIELIDGNSRPGGGALPLAELPSRLLCLVPGKLSAQFMERWLRSYDPPVISRLEKERVLLDVRTLQEKDLEVLAGALRELSEYAR